jgi:hypothetical protein
MNNSSQILLHLDALEGRIQYLVNQLKDAQEKLALSENENTLLKTAIKNQEVILKNLQKNQVNEQKDFRKREIFAKLVQNTGGLEGDTSEIKKTLDNYIKEIESCIAQLSN